MMTDNKDCSPPTSKNHWQPSPHVLLRFAGKSYEELDRLKFHQTVAIFEEIIPLRRWLGEQKQIICDEVLFQEIGLHRGSTRSKLVALKRDIFNERPLSIAKRRVLKTINKPAVRDQVLHYLRKHRRCQRLLENGRHIFSEELAAKRALLRESLRDPNYQKSVQLASPSLYAGLNGYLNTKPDQLKARQFRVEAGAFRYFSRMTSKTSPFASFGPLALASVEMNDPKAVRVRAKKLEIQSKANLNLGVIANVATSLSHAPSIQERLRPRVNYTYYLDEDEIIFICPKMEDNQPIYASLNTIRRGKYVPAMRQVIEFLEEQNGRHFTLNDMMVKMADPDSPTFQKTSAFVNRLAQAGLILREFRLPSDTLDRIPHLIEVLLSMGLETDSETINTLQRIRDICQTYATATVRERRQLHKTLQRHVDKLMRWWQPKSRAKAERDDFIVEDAIVGGIQVQLGRAFFDPLIADLGPFLDCIQARDRGGLSYAMLQDIFEVTYGQGGRCDNPMKFALEHMRIVMNTLAQRGLADTTNYPRSSAQNERVLQYLAAFGNDETPTFAVKESQVSHDTLAQLTEDFGGVPATPLSSALNLQIAAESWEAYEQGDFLVVFNYALPGFGHFYTRYCYLFEDEPEAPALTANLRNGLQTLQKNWPGQHELTEILSILDHNAQVHPCLTEKQIVPPNEVSSLPTDRQIPFRSLAIDHDPESDQLRLWTGNGNGSQRQIIPMYMGFFHMMALPSFHRLLVDLSPTGYHMERLKPNEHREGLLPFMKDDPAHAQPVRHYPRLRIGRFVLQREMWAFAPASLPPTDIEDDFTRFLETYAWAKEQELPREVFVRVQRERKLEKFNSDFRVAHKPMLVDFENFFTLTTFYYLVDTDDIEAAHIEEMLPNPRQLPLQVNGKRYAVEFQIELNRGLCTDD